MGAQRWADYVIMSFSARRGRKGDIDIEKGMDGGIPPSVIHGGSV